MTTINYSTTSDALSGAVKVEWDNLAKNDVGQAFDSTGLFLESVLISGNYDGSSVGVQCSNELTPTNFGTIVSKSDASYIGREEPNLPAFVGAVRPIVSGGTSPSLSIAMLFRKA